MAGCSIKVSIIGDGTVGKTCLWTVHTTNSFPSSYIPTVLDQCTSNVSVKGAIYKINIWDTAGQEDYDKLRLLTYPNTNVFIVCYAVNNRSSFKNVVVTWIPELKDHCPKVPFILVGTKIDTRTSKAQDKDDMVSASEGKKLSKILKAACFIECSALKSTNVELVFQEAVKTALGLKNSFLENCTLF